LAFATLVPRVRRNIEYAKPDPKSVEELLGIDGRLTGTAFQSLRISLE
jgi:predicted fused transcriptional regulator/phosphomethylpyrimidine kinase